ncbi:sodium:solute symporter family protein [Brachyspira pilosicoli]|uniref:sodium:solute symporter family protein n=1 Tax=Brachyspira pilosicoli TaxID=52584 RepID=UPI00258EA7E8|nr:sodium:solute symporter family protein [uncultured Brachyspira sp.]
MILGNWIILILSSLILIGIGFWTQLKIKKGSSEGFLLGAKSIGAFVGAGTLMATGYSGWGFIGSPGTTYAYGAIEIFANFFFAPAITFGTLFFAGFMKKKAEEAGGFTVPEYIAKTHNGNKTQKRIVHGLGGIATFVFLSVYIIGQIRAIGLVASQWLGVSEHLASIILMIVIIIFTVQGGLLAVAITDTIMCIGMLVASIIVYLTIIKDVSMTEIINSVGAIKPEFINPTTSNPYGEGKYKVFLVFIYAFLFTTTLPYMSVRFLSFKDKINIPVMALIMAPMGIILSLVPIVGLYMFYKNPNLPNPDSAMPVFLTSYLPPAIGGMIILFILFAMLSTISSVLQALASSLSHDLFVAFTDKAEKSSTVINRIGVVFTGVWGLVLTYIAPQGMLNQIAYIGTGGLIAMFVGPIMMKPFIQANITACLLSMITGLVTSTLFILKLNVGWVEAPIYAGLCACFVYVVSALLIKEKSEEKESDEEKTNIENCISSVAAEDVD